MSFVFVASFISTSNIIDGEISRIEKDHMIVKTNEGIEISCLAINCGKLAPGKRLLLCICSEDFELHVSRPKKDVNV